LVKNIMRKLLLAVALAAAGAGAGAQQATEEERVTVTRPQLTIEAPDHIRRFSKDDFEPYRAAYDLANGSEITLTRTGNRMYAEIDKQGKHEIVGTASNTFVALDRQLKLRLDLDRDGGAKGELLMAVPQTAVAGQAPAEPQYVLVALR
jgi:uncharacterized cupredoxin-like copper-binding protein